MLNKDCGCYIICIYLRWTLRPMCVQYCLDCFGGTDRIDWRQLLWKIVILANGSGVRLWVLSCDFYFSEVSLPERQCCHLIAVLSLKQWCQRMLSFCDSIVFVPCECCHSLTLLFFCLMWVVILWLLFLSHVSIAILWLFCFCPVWVVILWLYCFCPLLWNCYC